MRTFPFLRVPSESNITPLAADKSISGGFYNDTFRVANTMRPDKVIVNIRQNQREHQVEKSTVTDQQDMIVIFVFQRSNERQEAVPDVYKAFTILGFAQKIMAQSPILVVLTM